jgi:exopolyphosphatase/guanosine-5'-triphosphate,3'-diphosphate pyrophosphatase
MVRLAEGLDRSHGQVVRNVRLRTTRNGVRIVLSVKSDAELEQWAADRHAEPLAKMLGAPVRFETVGARRRRKRA